MDNEIFLVAGIIAGTAVILNVIFLWIIIANQRKINAVKTWPTTTGTVLASYLERRRSSNNSGTVNYPVVEYSYQVGGQIHRSSRIAPGSDVGGTGAEKMIQPYPVGAQLTVYYNPQNPAEAVLEKKTPMQWIMWVVLAALNVMLCGMAGIFAFALG